MILNIHILVLASAAFLSRTAGDRFNPIKRNLILAEKQSFPGTFKCPLGSVVKSFDIKKRNVYCETHDKTIGDERSYDLCEWQERCSLKAINQKDRAFVKWRLANGSDEMAAMTRGLRFAVGNPPYNVGKIEVFCCLTNCKTFRCQDLTIQGTTVDLKPKKNRYLNFVDWKPRRETIKAQYCQPKCMPKSTAACKAISNENKKFKKMKTLCDDYKCEIGSYVNGVDFTKRQMLCKKYGNEKDDIRNSKRCKWQSKCYSKTNQKYKNTNSNNRIIGIPRGLRFIIRKQFNKVLATELYCCKEACKAYKCDSYEEKDSKSQNNGFLNSVKWRHIAKKINAEYCQPTCILPPPGGPVIGIPIKNKCKANLNTCKRSSQCCSKYCHPSGKRCKTCKPANQFCYTDFECCSLTCNNQGCA